jgi:hypothetical protein
MSVGETSPLHSLTFKKAKQRRKLVLTPVSGNWRVGGNGHYESTLLIWCQAPSQDTAGRIVVGLTPSPDTTTVKR